MQITVNGDAMTVPPGTTVRTLLERMELGKTLVAVERNRQVVPRAQHVDALLADGDQIEVVHFVGGG